MPKPSPQRRRLYTLLNIGWRQLGWTETYYREACLAKHGAAANNGKISATTLTDQQLKAALADMKAEGFMPIGKKPRRTKPSGPRKGSDQGDQPASADQARLIRDLWARLQDAGAVRSADPASLRPWLLKNSRRHHPTGIGWSEPQFLNRRAAAAIIQQLKNWLSRLNQ